MLNSLKQIATAALESRFYPEHFVLPESGTTLGYQALNLSAPELGESFFVAGTLENTDTPVARQTPPCSFGILIIDEIRFDSTPKEAKEDPPEELSIDEIRFDSTPKEAKEDPPEELSIDEIRFDSTAKEVKNGMSMEGHQVYFDAQIDTSCFSEVTSVGIHEWLIGANF